MRIVLTYRAPGGALSLHVPNLRGFSPAEVADAAYAATHTPPSATYNVRGAADIAQAYFAGPAGRQTLAPLTVGDTVHAAGAVLRLVDEQAGEINAWGSHTPRFAVIEAYGGAGAVMHVTSTVPPPDEVAYAEDNRDRLWTGRGGGIWTCLTDPAGRTGAVSWRQAWTDWGPLRPLLPVTVSAVCPTCHQWGGGNCAACTRSLITGYDPGHSMLPDSMRTEPFVPPSVGPVRGSAAVNT